MNIKVQRWWFWDVDFLSFRYITRSRVAESYSRSIINLLRNPHIIFHSDCTGLCLHQQCKNSLFFTYFINSICYFLSFWWKTSGMRWYCGLEVHLICIDDYVVQCLFMYLLVIYMCFFFLMSKFLPLLILLLFIFICLFCYLFVCIPCICWILTLYKLDPNPNCDYPSHHHFSLWLPVGEGVPRPIRVLQGKITVNT